MSVIKMNVSLDERVVKTLKQRAAALKKPASRYLSDLILEEARRYQDELAEEGYRLLSEDTGQFAEAALPLAREVWPDWVNEAEETTREISKPE